MDKKSQKGKFVKWLKSWCEAIPSVRDVVIALVLKPIPLASKY